MPTTVCNSMLYNDLGEGLNKKMASKKIWAKSLHSKELYLIWYGILLKS